MRSELESIPEMSQFYSPLEIPHGTSIRTLTSRLCIGSYDTSFIKTSLEKLGTIDQGGLDTIIHLIEADFKWPREKSSRELSRFCGLLSKASPVSSPPVLLDNILRSIPDQTRVRLILCWILYGHRPLTSGEAVSVLHHRSDRTRSSPTLPPIFQVQEALDWLKDQLSAVVKIEHDQVSVHDHIWGVSEEGPRYIWNEVKATALETIVDFLISY